MENNLITVDLTPEVIDRIAELIEDENVGRFQAQLTAEEIGDYLRQIQIPIDSTAD